MTPGERLALAVRGADAFRLLALDTGSELHHAFARLAQELVREFASALDAAVDAVLGIAPPPANFPADPLMPDEWRPVVGLVWLPGGRETEDARYGIDQTDRGWIGAAFSDVSDALPFTTSGLLSSEAEARQWCERHAANTPKEKT